MLPAITEISTCKNEKSNIPKSNTGHIFQVFGPLFKGLQRLQLPQDLPNITPGLQDLDLDMKVHESFKNHMAKELELIESNQSCSPSCKICRSLGVRTYAKPMC